MSKKSHNYKGWNFSLKTGTTNDNKDGWMMGFSTKYAAGVWVGHHTSNVVMNGFMETMTQPIWSGFMQRAHDNLEPKQRERPSGVQTLPAYVVRTHVGVSSIEPSPDNDLFPSWYKKPGGGSNNEKIVRDKVSKKRSTECTPPLAVEEVTEGSAAQFSSDPFHGGATTSDESDDIHKCDDIKPAVAVESTDNGGGSYTFSVTVTAGTHPISSDDFKGHLSVTVDGTEIPNGSIEVGGPGVYQFSYTATAKGKKNVNASLTDSVLYEARSGVDVNFKSGNGNDSALLPSVNREIARRNEVTTSSGV